MLNGVPRLMLCGSFDLPLAVVAKGIEVHITGDGQSPARLLRASLAVPR